MRILSIDTDEESGEARRACATRAGNVKTRRLFAAFKSLGPTELNLSGLESFAFNYTVRWPWSLVISKKSLTKYQVGVSALRRFLSPGV